MAGRAPSKRNFSEVLESGAQVDDIFKDAPAPQGSNPFNLGDVAPAQEQESSLPPLSLEMSSSGTSDQDTLFCVNRKFAATEALFKLIGCDHLSFGQLISEILRIAMEQIKSEAGSFLEIDHQNQCMFFRAATGRASENLLNFTVPIGQGIVGFVCETQQPMALSSVDDSSVYLRSISAAVGFEAKNLIAYPVVIRGVTFGCIELLNRLGEPQFTDADKEVITTITEHAAKVIENRLVLSAMSKELQEHKEPKSSSGEDAA